MLGSGQREIPKGEAMKWTYYFSAGVIDGQTKSGAPIHAVPNKQHGLYVTSDRAIADYLTHHKDAVLVDYSGGASPSGIALAKGK